MSKLMKQSNYSISILPIDTLINIFSRLPIKSLLTLKSICKSWRSLITSRYFSNLHLHRNSLSIEKLLIFIGDDYSFYSVSLETLELAAIKIPFSSAWERFSRRKNIVGSCNGLLLCICDESSVSEALLINPSTLPCKKVPKLEVPQQCLYLSYGFGFDFVNDDYKIVRIAHFLGVRGDGTRWEVMNVSVGVYSLKFDTWKLVVSMIGPLGTPVSNNGTLVNNHLLHWLFSRGVSSNNEYRIDCFDVCREQWSQVELPDLSGSHDGLKDLGVLDGCLCLMTGGSDVWVMKEYGVEESWEKLFSMSDRCVIGSLNIVPITYSKEGNEILLRKDVFSKAFWYELCEKTTRTAEFHCLPSYRQVGVCIRSLISLCDNAQMAQR
ncbi:F-box protein CPR1-like [Silene latifolia]|uniref:F-box protein CPR1-like n=1 Tax=Silene latifolia TaxID=37657 RepID=UPI003D7762D6